MEIEDLLEVMSDGEFYSGVDLGKRLGKSRTAIWKMIPKLEALGIPVETVRGKGYRIKNGLDLLGAEEVVRQGLSNAEPVKTLKICLSTTSTNEDVLVLMERQRNEFGLRYSVVAAEHQCAGKGRRGRSWSSPFAENIYLSLGFTHEGHLSTLSGLSLVVGVSVVRALQGLGVNDLAIKWPNDILLHGKKIAGILVELRGEMSSRCGVVIGIGLNVHMGENTSIDQPWTSLAREGYSLKRRDVLVRLIDSLTECVSTFLSTGLAGFESEWRRFDWLAGKEVYVSGLEIEGEAKGINGQGELIIESEGRVLEVNAGEVSVRVQSNSA